jgi:uncharacterized membrane protein
MHSLIDTCGRMLRAALSLLLACVFAALLHAQGALQITSPTDGTVVHPGDTVTVTVSATGAAFAAVVIIPHSPIEWSDIATIPPYRFLIQIPSDITLGTYRLTASGVVTPGHPISSPAISIDVERPDAPVTLSTEPSSLLNLHIGERIVLNVIATYADGSTGDVTNSTRTTLASQSSNVVTVSPDGLVTALATGETQIVINGTLTIPVTVDPPVQIVPSQATLVASETEEFVAHVTNASNLAVTWSLSPSGLGSIDANGFYTAPDSISSQQTVTLTATSVADTSQTATAIITLSPAVSVSVVPGWAILYTSQTQQFTSNAGSAGVSWSISPAGVGSISSTGMYTAPASITSLQSVVVTATSVANPAISGQTTLWLSPQPFLLSLGDQGMTLVQGGSTSSFVLELATDSFSHPVAFSVGGLPAGVTASFAPVTVTGSGSTSITLTASSAVAPGDYQLAVTATDTVYPLLTQSQPLLLTVTASQGQAGFSLAAASQNVTTQPGNSATLAITEAATDQNWHTVAFSISGLPDGVTANFGPNPLMGTGSTTLNLSISSNAGVGAYTLTVTGNEAATATSQSITINLIITSWGVAEGALPAGWTNQDVGQSPEAGQTVFTNGAFQLQGSGSGALSSNTSDQFQYAFTGLQGDGMIVARLIAAQNSDSQTGIMIRNAPDPSSAFVALSVSNGGLYLLSRSAYGAQTSVLASGPGNTQLPVWLKLTRQGNNFSAYTSLDGVNWVQLSDIYGNPISTLVSMNANVDSGLIASAKFDNSPNTATFDSVVSTSAAAGFSLLSSTATLLGQLNAAATARITSVGTPGFADPIDFSITRLPDGATASLSTTSLTGSGSSILTLSIDSSVAAGSYLFTIAATDAITGATQTTTIALVVLPSTLTGGALPAGWSNQDVGQPAIAGQSVFSNGVFQLQGSGDGIWESDTSDQFQYAFTGLHGDGAIVARLLTVQNSDSDAGLMIRNSADPSSAYVMVSVSSGTVYVLSRPANGAPASVAVAGPDAVQLPAWLKLMRQGSSFSVYISPDGTNWTQITDESGNPIIVSVSMNSNVYAGLFASAAYDGSASAASFDAVTANSAGAGFSLSSSAGALLTQPDSTATATIISLGTPGFADAVNLSISGLPDGITASFNGNTLTGSGSSTLTVSTGSSVAPGTYSLVITGTDSTTAASQTTTIALVILPSTLVPGTLPAGWTNQDVGQPAIAGQSAFSSGVFQLQGSGMGALVNTASDQFQYAFTGLQGDGAIVARLLATQNSNSQAGIMIRNSLDPSSAYAALFLSSGAVNFVSRSAYAVQTGTASGSISAQLPVWLKLARHGDSFSAFTSPDGTSWTQIGSTISLPMNANVYAGLIDTATYNGPLNTAIFDTVTATSTGSGFSLSSSVATLLTQPGTTATTTITNLGTPGFADPVSLSISGLPDGITAGFSTNSLTGSGNSTLTFSIGSSAIAGSYSVTITGTDGVTATNQATVVNLIVLPTTPASGALPVGWVNQDVGQPGIAGQSAFSNGVFQLQGSGNGTLASDTSDSSQLVSDNNDQFQYAFTALPGDGAIVARVLTTQRSDSQVGIMIRGGLDPISPYVMLSISNGGLSLLNRFYPDSPTYLLASGSADLQFPAWLKLVRQADNISAFISPDGANWTQVGYSAWLPISGTTYAGLVDTSTYNGSLNAAAFDNIAVANSGADFALVSSTATLSAQPGSTATAVISCFRTPGFTDAISLSAGGLPDGITATFNTMSATAPERSTLTVSIGSSVAAGNYSLTIIGTDAVTGSNQTTTMSLVVLPSAVLPQDTLPAGWTNQDIGQPGISGQSLFSNGVFQLQGSGHGVLAYDTSDQFQYAFTGLQGNGMIVARLLPTQDSDSQAGIMIRNNLDPTSAYATLYMSGGSIYFLTRSADGDETSLQSARPANAQSPVWLALARYANYVFAYTSPDGINWTPFGDIQYVFVSMDSNVYAGLVDTSTYNSSLNTATFDSVTATGAPWGFSLLTSASTLLTRPNTVATTTITSLATPYFGGTINLSASGLPNAVTANFGVNTLMGSGSTSLTFSIGAGAVAGSYPVTITGAVADASQSATVTLVIGSVSSVSVTPAAVTLSGSQAQQFTATVYNTSNTSVNWTISPSAGSISSSGLYTAPVSISSQQAVMVTATSVADTSQSASAAITLMPAGSAGAATQLRFTTQPADSVAGSTMAAVVVQVQDATGNLVAGSTASITLTSNPSGISASTAAVNGVATFSSLVAATAGNYTFIAGSSGLTSATSNSFSVNPPAQQHLSILWGGTSDGYFSGGSSFASLANYRFETRLHGIQPRSQSDPQLNQYVVLGPSALSLYLSPDGTNMTASVEGNYCTVTLNGATDVTVRFQRTVGTGYSLQVWDLTGQLVGSQGPSTCGSTGSGTVDLSSDLYLGGIYSQKYLGAMAFFRFYSTAAPDSSVVPSEVIPGGELVRHEFDDSAALGQDASGSGHNLTFEGTPASVATPNGPTLWFTISPGSTSVTTTVGSAATVAIAESVTGGFSDQVTYSVTGLPTGIAGSFSPASLEGAGTTNLNLTVGPGAAVGTYTLIITGTDTVTNATQDVSVSLTVNPPVQEHLSILWGGTSDGYFSGGSSFASLANYRFETRLHGIQPRSQSDPQLNQYVVLGPSALSLYLSPDGTNMTASVEGNYCTVTLNGATDVTVRFQRTVGTGYSLQVWDLTGQLVGSQGPSTCGSTGSGTVDLSSDLYLGGIYSQKYLGAMAFFRFYSTAAPDSSVVPSEVIPGGELVRHEFDDSAALGQDASGSGHNLTFEGTPTSVATP